MNISQIYENNISNTFNTFNTNKKSEGSEFKNLFSQALSNLENSQSKVTEQQKEFINGNLEVHELLSTVAESELTLKLATSIAGKCVTAIQELTNMQI